MNGRHLGYCRMVALGNSLAVNSVSGTMVSVYICNLIFNEIYISISSIHGFSSYLLLSFLTLL
jgi:hypothetical protein